ncbi:methyltransferase type 11 [Massilia sp. CCM 8733]|uniref:Methyltransferase type 11 n=1 Tax=Massilia mucilaginosa TaxID=2609282 RepID=A0ABX0P0F3_9BURK|nr:methyltransferase type 11 [Massilia mucilaginosa]NHZ92766.1 methyltransferase type 11 [Massilia mucilaginosa]
MAAPASADHWQAHARQWSRIGGPLRPCAQDVAIMRAILGPAPGLGLLLGVTPELTVLSERLISVERDAAMIERHWLPRGSGQSVRQGDWLELPLAPDSVDFASGDGSLTMLRYAGGYARLFGQLYACLRNQATLALRVFAAPEWPETPQQVADDALRGAIGSFHAFKWRLAMALAGQAGDPDIAVGTIGEAVGRLAPERDALAQRAGWPRADIDTIDAYRGSVAVYSFPTLAQLRCAIPAGFEEIGVFYGTYELAQCCPIIALRLHK